MYDVKDLAYMLDVAGTQTIVSPTAYRCIDFATFIANTVGRPDLAEEWAAKLKKWSGDSLPDRLWFCGISVLTYFVIPLLILTPLTFLGGTFYSIDVLPPLWQKIALFNPIVYLVSGFRWSFFESSDVHLGVSVAMTLLFLALCLGAIAWIFKTGYRIKN